MNQKRAYKTDEPVPVFVDEVTVNGKTLRKGQELTLNKGTNRPAGRYRFEYAEHSTLGQTLLFVYGPIRRTNQRQRMISPEVIRTIHGRT